MELIDKVEEYLEYTKTKLKKYTDIIEINKNCTVLNGAIDLFKAQIVTLELLIEFNNQNNKK